MEKVIITTPEELRSIIVEAVQSCKKTERRDIKDGISDNLTIDNAVTFLSENGFPTSKPQLYKLTSAKKVPHLKYGSRLVFSRKALLQWAQTSCVNFSKDGDTQAIIAYANREKRR